MRQITSRHERRIEHGSYTEIWRTLGNTAFFPLKKFRDFILSSPDLRPLQDNAGREWYVDNTRRV